MTLWILVYLAGALTILSPCILPVLPFVFAKSDQPFRRSGLPLLIGMAGTFAGVATIAAVGGAWAVQANQYGRIAAMVLLALFALTLLSSKLAEKLMHPFVSLGGRLTQTPSAESGPGRSFLVGIATGLLWAPCAGPILGLVLTGAALSGASAQTSVLLLVYAAGAATSLALALAAGGRLLRVLKRYLVADVWVRRGLGVAVLLGVAVIAFGWDRSILTRVSTASTAAIEQRLINMLQASAPMTTMSDGTALGDEGALPELNGAVAWLNSPPLTRAALRGKVVLVDFWTYSCINCLRSLPYVKAWADKYKDAGLVVIGVHAPEFAFEKDPGNVGKAVRDLNVDYPVAIDNNYAIWNAFGNHYWPAHYFIDARGRIRYHHFGEGEYDHSESVIQQLLRERSGNIVPTRLVQLDVGGTQAAPDPQDQASPETYIGYARARGLVSPAVIEDKVGHYRVPARLKLNQWGLAGAWNIGAENAALASAPGKIVFRFHARDLHLVLGPAADGKPVRFNVKIDGAAPARDHGMDTDAQGRGTVTEHRLYQLIRQQGDIRDRTFEIEFLDPGAQAFAFTFG